MGAADKLLKQYDSKPGKTFKIGAGEKKYVRLLPPYDPEVALRAKKMGAVMDAKLGMCSCKVHKFLPKLNPTKDEIDRAQKFGKGDKIPVTNYRCLRDFKKPCPFCQFFDNLGKADREIAREYGSSPSTWADFYVKDIGMVQRWYLPKSIITRIGEIFDILPNLNHPTKGRNLLIARTGTTMFDTKYTAEVSKKVTPLPLSDDQLPSDLLQEIENNVVVPGPKTARKVLKLKFPDLAI